MCKVWKEKLQKCVQNLDSEWTNINNIFLHQSHVNLTKNINTCRGPWVIMKIMYCNKRPKGPHIVHLSTICHLFLGQGGHFCLLIGPVNTNMVEDVEKFHWIPFSVSEEKSKMSKPIRGQGGHLVFWSAWKIQTWGRTMRSCFLLSFVEFRSAFSEEKSKMSQPIRGQGGNLVFSDRPEKHKLGRGHCNLASCQVSLNSVQRLQRRSRKCLSQSEVRMAILIFQSARKTQTWYRTLRSCFLLSFVEFHSAVSEEKSKMSQPIRGQGGHLVFQIGLKNTN